MKKQRWISTASVPSLTTVGALLLLTPMQGAAQNLGSVSFPTSGAAEAQPYFEAGLLLLHNFEYEDAAAQFRKAREIDPGFAMAVEGPQGGEEAEADGFAAKELEVVLAGVGGQLRGKPEQPEAEPLGLRRPPGAGEEVFA